MIKIDKNIPIPDGRYTNGGITKYPFRDMEVGDSFFVPDEGKTGKQWQQKLYMYAASIRRHGMPELRITAKIVTENNISGVRVWRIEKPCH